MRLATWNCRAGVDRKRDLFDRIGADVFVVPECPESPDFSRELGVSFAWRGQGRKGLAVFGVNGWQITPAAESEVLPWVLPLRILDPVGTEVALLLAIWTVPTERVRVYADQIALAITHWEPEIRDGSTILAGDFNCSAQTADSRRHRVNVERLRGMGAVSAYHEYCGVGHGDEEAMTLRWVGKGGVPHGFHCDFVFASAAIAPGIAHVEVGTFDEWIDPGHSDHCPVVVDFADSVERVSQRMAAGVPVGSPPHPGRHPHGGASPA